MVKLGKEFIWEMSHRLPFHEGPCKNIHGHSYKMLLQLEGDLGDNRMLIDFYDIERIVKPLIDKLDHAFVVDAEDKLMLDFLKENNFKYYTISKYSTAEDLSLHILEKTKDDFKALGNIKNMAIRVYETQDAWAEVSTEL